MFIIILGLKYAKIRALYCDGRYICIYMYIQTVYRVKLTTLDGYRVHSDPSLLNVNRQSVNRRLFYPFPSSPQNCLKLRKQRPSDALTVDIQQEMGPNGPDIR